MATLNEWQKDFDKDKDIEAHFVKPLHEILLMLKAVDRDKERKVPTPYVKAEILIPHQVATNIKDLMNSDWRLCLLGVKYKKK